MSAKILVVDDERPLSKALELKLTAAGYSVDVANDGSEALNKITTPYDLILLDLVMPNLNGFDFLQKLKDAGSNAKVFVLSNLSQESDKEKALSLGALKFFIKSNTPLATVVEEIKKVL